MNSIPFQLIDWSAIPQTEHPGEKGTSFWRAIEFAGLHIRIVEYAAGYLADHWCQKGHVVHCLSGSFITELQDGTSFELTEGMTYVVSDNMSSHRSSTVGGVKLLITDGDFLK